MEYFDHNATTPLSPAARRTWLETLDSAWHNASSLHREGAASRERLEAARDACAELLATDAEQIVFTSGATESNNAVIAHFARKFPNQKIAISALEHPSVRDAAEYFAADRLIIVPATAGGVVCVESLKQILADNAIALLSVMAANNETGVIQPWHTAAALAKEAGVAFHCDAAQWIGKLPVGDLGTADFLTASAHKFGGPKGVGILKVPAGLTGFASLRGGPQENRKRAGTENVPAIAASAAAWQALEPTLLEYLPRAAWRDAFERKLALLVPGTQVIAAQSPRLWNTSMVVMPEFPNIRWLARLSDLGFAISTGSACSSGGGASEVLSSMGMGGDALKRVLRISGGWATTEAAWLDLAEAFAQVHRKFHSKRGK